MSHSQSGLCSRYCSVWQAWVRIWRSWWWRGSCCRCLCRRSSASTTCYWTEPAARKQTGACRQQRTSPQTVTNTCSSTLRETICSWTRYKISATNKLIQTHHKTASTSVLICVAFYFQDGVNGVRETVIGSEKKTKRHMEKEGLEAERRAKDKKHSHKRQKMNKKNLQRRTSSSPRSDFSQSDDSDEEMAVCPAERCQLPEGDEVRKTLVNY